MTSTGNDIRDPRIRTIRVRMWITRSVPRKGPTCTPRRQVTITRTRPRSSSVRALILARWPRRNSRSGTTWRAIRWDRSTWRSRRTTAPPRIPSSNETDTRATSGTWRSSISLHTRERPSLSVFGVLLERGLKATAWLTTSTSGRPSNIRAVAVISIPATASA